MTCEREKQREATRMPITMYICTDIRLKGLSRPGPLRSRMIEMIAPGHSELVMRSTERMFERLRLRSFCYLRCAISMHLLMDNGVSSAFFDL
ncbi:hypothetical protein BDN71DRAFT_1438523 [Pleurotus eryngii]|uniref:Uncharacterized protein n=1 Tax=Pleurotus eryngii TaxID=5323 RepID=A0A9P6DL46_PLEER|nr:hypothetical protein BDN71DRAFT_1438523 [Pleurotus eryngii]